MFISSGLDRVSLPSNLSVFPAHTPHRRYGSGQEEEGTLSLITLDDTALRHFHNLQDYASSSATTNQVS